MVKKQESVESIFSKIDPENIKEAASSVADEAAEFIKKHPFESVAGALFVGVLVGLFINRK